MTMKSVYMLREIDNSEGHRMAAESIYDISDQEATRLIEAGAAVPTSFPKLDGFAQSVERLTVQYDDLVDKIEASGTLGDLEKKFRIVEARDSLTARIDKLRKDYEVEVKAESLLAATEMFKMPKPSEEATQYVEGILSHMRAGHSAETVVSLIETALPSLPPEYKSAVLQRLPEIKTEAGKNAKAFDRLAAKLYDKSTQIKYDQLKAYGERNPFTAFDFMQSSHRTFKRSYLTAEDKVKYQAEQELKRAMAAMEG
ncbi:hypothetical protein ACQKLN_11025 [Paenibacillus glucanolyticus]|uniref:hypothetical protein n=2 Tax=Paenibacillus glucanolyticus TaxID=59843 RepID=UPI0034CF1E44